MIDEVALRPRPMYEAFTQGLIDVQDEVRAAFGWAIAPDRESAEQMVDLVNDHGERINLWTSNGRQESLQALRKRLAGAEEIVILGAAVTAAEVLNLPKTPHLIIAADGAVGALDDDAHLACVVSDFDGGIHLDAAAEIGVLIVAHAHGDNVERWRSSLEHWATSPSPPPLILSHQTPDALDGAYNFGGFTDGDRAVCFALALGISKEKIRLVGFSLDEVGRWSGSTIPEQKLRKLAWMNSILSSIGMNDAVKK